MAIQSIIRFLLPKDEHWYDVLERLGTYGHQASRELLRFKDAPARQVQEAVQLIEHQADNEVRRMEDALARTFVTPLDREDLHRLTSQLDDIIDLMNLSARAFTLYQLERPTVPMLQIMERLEVGTRLIAEAVPHLRTHQYARLIDEARKVRAIEKEADAIYRNAISELFTRP